MDVQDIRLWGIAIIIVLALSGWLFHERIAKAEYACAEHADTAEQASATAVGAMQGATEAMEVSVDAMEVSAEMAKGLFGLQDEVIQKMKQTLRNRERSRR